MIVRRCSAIRDSPIRNWNDSETSLYSFFLRIDIEVFRSQLVSVRERSKREGIQRKAHRQKGVYLRCR